MIPTPAATHGRLARPEGPLVTVSPFVDEGFGNSSYLVDIGDGRALVIDPTRDVSGYVRAAERAGLRLAFSLETHPHADFVSGSRELAQIGDWSRAIGEPLATGV